MLKTSVVLATLLTTGILSAPTSHEHVSRDNRPYWQCDPGQQYDTATTACKACPIGTFSPAGVQCYASPLGFYNNQVGSTDPRGCLPGTYTDSTGLSTCKSCPALQFSYAAATSCSVCADGSSAAANGQRCVACPPGKNSVGGAACTACSPGYFSPAGNSCHPTPAGFYNDKSGSTDPIGCDGGSYTDVESSIVCKKCTAPLMSFAAATKCVACASGSTSTDGQNCIPFIVTCSPGSAPSAGSCKKCPAGSFSPAGNSCHPTPAGFYNDKKEATDPIGCDGGSYTDVESSIVCKKCTSPQMSFAAATKCIACPDGSSSSDGKNCVACLPGSSSIGGATCLACTPGHFSPDGRNCYYTPAGFYNNAAGQKNPIGCLPGTFTAVESSIVCIKCTGGQTSFAASTKCDAPVDSSNACPPSTCAIGSYIPSGSSACVTIPNYNILIRDALDTKTLGYMGKDYYGNTIFVDTPSQVKAMVISPPSLLCSNLPQNLVGTTQAGSNGKNIDIAMGYASYGVIFDANHTSYVWLSGGTQDNNPDAFKQTADWTGQGAESDVWVLSPTDASGRIPLSLNFLDLSSKVVTCATFLEYSDLKLIGGTCATDWSSAGGAGSYNTVLLYLVPVSK